MVSVLTYRYTHILEQTFVRRSNPLLTTQDPENSFFDGNSYSHIQYAVTVWRKWSEFPFYLHTEHTTSAKHVSDAWYHTNKCYSPAGRSVLRKTVLKTEGTVFPDTGRLRLVNNTFFSLSLTKFFPKKNPNDLVEGCSNGKIFHWNWTIFERVCGSLNRGNAN